MTEPTQINQATLTALGEGVALPTYDRSQVTSGIVHFGVGGFHRAHQAMYLDTLMNDGQALDWGITGVGLMPGDKLMHDVLHAQDCLYTLVVKDADGTMHPRVIGSIVNYLFAPDDPEAVLRVLSDPATRIVSLTITEGGYLVNQATGEFDAADPSIQADLADGAVPATAFGFVVEALRRRREAGVEPFTVMSCDNIQGNGEVAHKMIGAFARLKDADLASWLEEHVTFPNSMVDRITPVTTDADRATAGRAVRRPRRLARAVRAVHAVGARGPLPHRAAAVRGRRRAAGPRRRAVRADEAAAAQREPPGAVLPRLPGGLPLRPRGVQRRAVHRLPARLHAGRGDADAGPRAGRRPDGVPAQADRALRQPRDPRHPGAAVRRELRPDPQVAGARHPRGARARWAGEAVRAGGRELGALRRGRRRAGRADRRRRPPQGRA